MLAKASDAKILMPVDPLMMLELINLLAESVGEDVKIRVFSEIAHPIA